MSDESESMRAENALLREENKRLCDALTPDVIDVKINAALRAEVERLKAALTDAEWRASASEADLRQLSRVVGRTTRELVFERDGGGRQTPTAYVLADGRAYALILGALARLHPTVDALGRSLCLLLGAGYKFVEARKPQRGDGR